MTFDEFMQDSTLEQKLRRWRLGGSTAAGNAWRITADSFVPTITSSSITIHGGRAWDGTYDTAIRDTAIDWRTAYERICTGTYINGAPDRPRKPETFDTDGVKGFLDGIEVNDDR